MQTMSVNFCFSSHKLLIGLSLALLALCTFTQANAFYVPYSSLPYASRLQVLQRQTRVPSAAVGGPARSHGQSSQQQQPIELAVLVDPMAKRERPYGNSYGWEQCEFSPISCLIRRRR